MQSWKFNVPVSEPWRFNLPFEAKFPSSYVTCILLSFLDTKGEVCRLLQIVSHRSRGFVVQRDGMKELVSKPAYLLLNSIDDVKYTGRSDYELEDKDKIKIFVSFSNNTNLQDAIDQIERHFY